MYVLRKERSFQIDFRNVLDPLVDRPDVARVPNDICVVIIDKLNILEFCPDIGHPGFYRQWVQTVVDQSACLAFLGDQPKEFSYRRAVVRVAPHTWHPLKIERIQHCAQVP